MDGGDYTRDYAILYVDDEHENRVVFQALFGGEFSVLCAPTAREALRILASRPVAVIVSDQRMPEMSGIELCEEVRRRYPDVIRLLVTAYSDHDTAVCAINDAGVAGYLVKPWDIDDIFRILRDMVARAHTDRLARKLRSALLEKERLFGLAATRAHILHDLSNIHVVIVDCGETLSDITESLEGQVAPGVLVELRSKVGELKAASDYIMALHDRTHSWHSPSEKDPLRMVELLDAVSAMVRDEIAPVADLVFDCPESTYVWADRIDVSRILVNLILNAARAIGTSSIDGGAIRISVTPRGHRVDVEVRDNGPGIPTSTCSGIPIFVGCSATCRSTFAGAAVSIATSSSDSETLRTPASFGFTRSRPPAPIPGPHVPTGWSSAPAPRATSSACSRPWSSSGPAPTSRRSISSRSGSASRSSRRRCARPASTGIAT